MRAILTRKIIATGFIDCSWKRHLHYFDVRTATATNQYSALLVPTATVLRKAVKDLAEYVVNEHESWLFRFYQLQHSMDIFLTVLNFWVRLHWWLSVRCVVSEGENPAFQYSIPE